MSQGNSEILVIYESPNKYKLFKSLFNEVGLECKFVYTQGKVFDLPKDSLGITEDGGVTLEPVNEKRLNYLKSAIESSDRVLCLTDMDDEGELIAKSIKDLCSDSPSTKFLRLRLNEYTPDSLISAFKSGTEELDSDAINKAYSRRYIDRFIGFTDNEDKMLQRGRVLTPFVQNIYEEPIQLKKKVEYTKGDMFLSFRTVISDDISVKIIEELEEHIRSAKLEPVDTLNTLPNTEECLQYQMSRFTDITATEAVEELQELYQSGKVSYPRTESSKYNVMEGQHSGIRDLDGEETSDDDDTLLSFIKKRTSFALNNKEKIYKVELNDSLKLKLEESGIFHFKAHIVPSIRNTPDAISYLSPYSMLNKAGSPAKINDAKVLSYNLSVHQRVLDRLVRTNLAQPSTLHTHCDKVAKLVKEETGTISLNIKGLRVAVQGDRISNTIKSMDNALKINNILNKKSINIDEKISKCLNIFGQNGNSSEDNDFPLL
jgi:5S rRNA maturation endonuclease (ribonuclease M5)